MTQDEYLDALRAAARAGDRKAAAFLENYAAGLVDVPLLPPCKPIESPAGAAAA
jgi:hypothetical protein